MPNNNRGHLAGGEHPNGRRAMHDLQKRLRNEGYSQEKARRVARETALREDRKRNNRR